MAVILLTIGFIVVAIMTFFSCCRPPACFRSRQVEDSADLHEPTVPRPPQHDHFRSVSYGTYDGPASAVRRGDGGASSLASQVSPRTTPTNAVRATNDNSSSVYSQPTNSRNSPSLEDTPLDFQSPPILEVGCASTNKVGANEHDVESDAEAERTMKEALNKITEARMVESKGAQ